MTSSSELVKKFRKDYGQNVALIGRQAWVDMPRIPTGIFPVDLAMGGGFIRGKVNIVFGPESSNKCHAKGTRILMFDGTFKNVEDIVPGDKVMGVDSSPRTVQQAGKGHGMLYRITPVKGGDSFVVNEDHLLSLMCTHDQGSRRRGDVVTISLKDYMQKSNDWKVYHHLYRVPVEFPAKNVPLDPYFLGLWLGDGASWKPVITTMDTEIVDWLQDFADKNGWELSCYAADGRCPMYAVVGERQGRAHERYLTPTDHLKKLGVFGDKHVPHLYKANCPDVQRRVLAGLLDSDGNRGTGSSMGFVNTNKRLCEDVMFLARSLGFYASMKRVDGEYNGRAYVHYTVYLSGDFSTLPLQLERKRPESRSRAGSALTSRFTVEQLEEDTFYGFILDGDHLYLLDSFIVNHNTNLMLGAIREGQKMFPGEKAVVVDAEHDLNVPWAEKLGVDPDRLIILYPEYAEQAADFVESFLYAEDVFLVGLDSIAALCKQSEAESDMSKASYGGASILTNKMFRKLVVAFSKMQNAGKIAPAFIGINQIRFKMDAGPHGNPETLPGGQAQKYAASMLLRTYAKNVMDTKLHPAMPAFKEGSVVIKKWKCPILAVNAEYKMQMVSGGGHLPGYVKDWNTISTYMQELDYLSKVDAAKPGSGWLMSGEQYPTLKACEEALYGDPIALQEMKAAIISEMLEKAQADEKQAAKLGEGDHADDVVTEEEVAV